MWRIRNLLTFKRQPSFEKIRGVVHQHLADPTNNTPSLSTRLDRPLPLTLEAKEEIATNSFAFRFSLPDESLPLGIFPCEYLTFEKENPKTKQLETRHYSPISSPLDVGYVDFIIKIYLRDFKHPTGGFFSQYIDQLKIGDTLDVVAVGSQLRYLGRGRFTLRNPESGQYETRTFRHVGLIAGGTGLTPFYQIMSAVAGYADDTTGLSLIYLNQSPFDVLLDQDLLEFEQMNQLFYLPVVESSDETWPYGVGKISREMVEAFMPPPGMADSVVFVCGPSAMNNHVRGLFEEMGYPAEQYYFV